MLLIMGFGGHARSAADIALSRGFNDLIFVDAQARENEYFLNYPVLAQAPPGQWHCVLGAGHNRLREKQWDEALKQNWFIETLSSPLASRGAGSLIGLGSLIAHHAHVGPLSTIGKACIINTGAIVEHDCRVGDFSHVAVNATLAGGVVVGRHVFIGANAIVRNGITICDQVTIGAGSTVISSITKPGVYVGTPSKLLKSETVC